MLDIMELLKLLVKKMKYSMVVIVFGIEGKEDLLLELMMLWKKKRWIFVVDSDDDE